MTAAMTIKEATRVLNQTSALGAFEALHFDVARTFTGKSHKFIKKQIREILEPVGHLLRSQVYSDNQFASASGNLDLKYGLIQRGDGHRVLVTTSVADEVFRNRRAFGADTIAELKQAIKVASGQTVTTPDAEPSVEALTTKQISEIVDGLDTDRFHSFIEVIENFIEAAKDRHTVAETATCRSKVLDNLRGVIKGACDLM